GSARGECSGLIREGKRKSRQNGLIIVSSQFSADGILITFRERCDRFGNTPVIELPFDRTQLAVGNLAQFVVRKIIGLLSLQPDDPPLPEFIKQRNQTFFIPMSRLVRKLASERPADTCRK